MKNNIFFFLFGLYLLLATTEILNAQSVPLVLTSFRTSSSYQAYVNFAVNNAHFLANDNQGHIYVVFVDSVEQITVMTRESGIWYSQIVATAGISEAYKSPTIQWSQGKLHVSWFVISSDSSIIKYGTGTPLSTGTYTWNITSFATIPSGAPKYLTMTVPDLAFNPHFGFTVASDHTARLFRSSGESSISPLQSGLGVLVTSSDVTIASDSNIIVVAWEEEWAVPVPKDRLVFTISYDGGVTWAPTQNLLNSGPTPGGDPSLAIADSIVYVAFQKTNFHSSTNIKVARKFPSMDQFELLNLGTPDSGIVANGWLTNIDIDKANPDKFVVSWERTDGDYFDKWEHRVAVAYIYNAASQNPLLIIGPETTSPAADTSLYDLNSNIIISPDGQIASYVWVNVNEISSSRVILTLYFQEDEIQGVTTIESEELTSRARLNFFPNPVNNLISFSNSQRNIKIFGITGKLLIENNNDTFSVDVSSLPS
ncbi:MAG: T9SS type A sorting domain-containing protein, partial [Ignavibacteriaceae bacterium]|nr:T9SS type A sorting domain-containing protein [Ignavibacteriaceae bacterium]